MTIVKRVVSFRVVFGGEQHRGWLPPEAATPLPTPEENALLDVKIDDYGDGYLLIWQSQCGKHAGDSWHPSLEKATAQAESCFGILPEDW